MSTRTLSTQAAMMSAFAGRSSALERLQLSLLMRQYCVRLIFESRVGIDLEQLERLGASDSEIDGIAQALFDAEEQPVDEAAPVVDRTLYQYQYQYSIQIVFHSGVVKIMEMHSNTILVSMPVQHLNSTK